MITPVFLEFLDKDITAYILLHNVTCCVTS